MNEETKFKKGQKGGPGRPKGAPNKVQQAVKEMITEALNRAGGVEYLVERANDPKTANAFIALVGKVLPLQVTGDPKNPVQHNMTITFRAIE